MEAWLELQREPAQPDPNDESQNATGSYTAGPVAIEHITAFAVRASYIETHLY